MLFESFDALVSKIRYSLFMLSVRAFNSVKNGLSVVLYLEYIDKYPTLFSVDLKYLSAKNILYIPCPSFKSG